MAKNQPPAFRALPKDQRRQRIIWAAKSMFLEKGFDAANMDDVAARAGTTKPTVYAHFATKEALFAAVVDLIRGHYLGKLKDPSAYAADPVEAVARFWPGSWNSSLGGTPWAFSGWPWPRQGTRLSWPGPCTIPRTGKPAGPWPAT